MYLHLTVLLCVVLRVLPLLCRLYTDGSNLPLVVRDLRNHHKKDFKDWLEHLRTVLPDLQTIDVIERPEDGYLYLNVHYSNLELPCPFVVVV